MLEITRPLVVSWHPDLRCRRAIENRCFAYHALGALPDRLGWLIDKPAAEAGRFKFSFDLLAELGRFREPDLICFFAREVVEIEPRLTRAQAVRRLRFWRVLLAQREVAE